MHASGMREWKAEGQKEKEEEEANTKSMEGAGRMIYWIPVRGGGMVVTDKEQVARRELGGWRDGTNLVSEANEGRGNIHFRLSCLRRRK